MAVSKAYLCTKICDMVGHVRQNPTMNGFNKRELLIIFTYLTINKEGDKPNTKKKK